MHWQDLVIGASYILFNLALIPSIKSRDKPALQTSLLTGTINLIIALTQLTLELWISSLFTLINASLWFILAYQKYKSK